MIGRARSRAYRPRMLLDFAYEILQVILLIAFIVLCVGPGLDYLVITIRALVGAE